MTEDAREERSGSVDSTSLSDSEKQRRRNLIFDEERFEETFLKCLICREMYNEVSIHCFRSHTWIADLISNPARLAPNGTNLGLFEISFLYILTPQVHIFVQYGNNLTK